jgi:hypothetical protein
MKLPLRPDWLALAMTLNALAAPGAGPSSAVAPLLGMILSSSKRWCGLS